MSQKIVDYTLDNLTPANPDASLPGNRDRVHGGRRPGRDHAWHVSAGAGFRRRRPAERRASAREAQRQEVLRATRLQGRQRRHRTADARRVERTPVRSLSGAGHRARATSISCPRSRPSAYGSGRRPRNSSRSAPGHLVRRRPGLRHRHARGLRRTASSTRCTRSRTAPSPPAPAISCSPELEQRHRPVQRARWRRCSSTTTSRSSSKSQLDERRSHPQWYLTYKQEEIKSSLAFGEPSGEFYLDLPSASWIQEFPGGIVMYHDANGQAFEMHGAILQAYWALPDPRADRLSRSPTRSTARRAAAGRASSAAAASTGRRKTGAVPVIGQIWVDYEGMGEAGAIGLPVAAAVAHRRRTAAGLPARADVLQVGSVEGV